MVTVARMGFDTESLGSTCELVVVGPFRTRERADDRARVIRELAEQYEDPEGVTGPDNALAVVVEPLRAGRASAQLALDYLYGSVVG